MSDLQCWVFGLFLSLLTTQCDPGDRASDWVTGPNREAAPNFPGCKLSTDDFANLAWTPKDGRSTNFELRIWWTDAEAKCTSMSPLVTALPTGPSGCTLADTQKGIQTLGLRVILHTECERSPVP